jgi:biopolymer transport protein TolQ
MQELAWLVAAEGAAAIDIWSLVGQASAVVKAVMALLALMSIVCWYIIGFKYFQLRKSAQESATFLEVFWRTRDIEQIYQRAQTLRGGPVAAMFLAGYSELAKLSSDGAKAKPDDLHNVQRALHKAQTAETTKLEGKISFLATTGSAAPFIGLFGTVWGIMNSFRHLSPGTSTIQAVAPGIAEALFATAIGLVAAIPAVMAFNYFQRRLRVQVSEMETFEQDYLNIIRRHFLS